MSVDHSCKDDLVKAHANNPIAGRLRQEDFEL